MSYTVGSRCVIPAGFSRKTSSLWLVWSHSSCTCEIVARKRDPNHPCERQMKMGGFDLQDRTIVPVFCRSLWMVRGMSCEMRVKSRGKNHPYCCILCPMAIINPSYTRIGFLWTEGWWCHPLLCTTVSIINWFTPEVRVCTWTKQENMHDLLLPKGRSSLVAKAVVFCFSCSQLTRCLWHVLSLDV